MLDDPRTNFAISKRGHATGVKQLSFQLDNDSDLKAMPDQLVAADAGLDAQTARYAATFSPKILHHRSYRNRLGDLP